MNLNSLFKYQKKLDDRIEKEHDLSNRDTFTERLVALSVELAELKNELPETFKFWSNKKNNRDRAVEEYIDCIHFAISIALKKGLDSHTYIQTQPKDLNKLYLGLQNVVTVLSVSYKQRHVKELLNNLIALGYQLNLTESDVIAAYHDKNKVNHSRQDNGY